jgi:large subunit ribosomal protein L28
MSAVCELCGKGPGFGMRVSHSHRRHRRTFGANIQKRRVLVDGTPRRIFVCTGCLKAGKATPRGGAAR